MGAGTGEAQGRDGDARALARVERSIRAWPCPDADGPAVAFAFPGRGRDGHAALCLDYLSERGGLPVAVAVEGHPRSGPEELLALARAGLGSPPGRALRARMARERHGHTVAARFGAAVASGLHPGPSLPEAGRRGPWRAAAEDPLTAALARRSGASVREAVAAAGFSPGFLDGLALLGSGPHDRAEWVWALFAPDPLGASARALARDYPLLSWLAPRIEAAREALRAGAPVAAALFPHAPNPEALLRRFRGVGARGRDGACLPGILGTEPAAIATALRFVSGLPLDWIGPGVPGIGALAELAREMPAVAALLRTSTGTLVAPCGGRFEAYLARCGGPSDHRRSSLWERAMHARDGVDDLARRILAPLLARSYVETGEGCGEEAALRTRAYGIAHGLLVARRGLPAILERSARWHRLLPAIDARMPRDDAPERRWDPGCPPFRLGEIEIRALVSARELADEGADGPDSDGMPGLSHCVSGYAGRCLAGQIDILSVRRVPRDGKPASRLSTVEIVHDGYGEGDARVAQHRGRRNGPPPIEAERAVAACLARGGWVRRVPPPWLEPFDAIARACGYDWADEALMEAAVTAYDPALPAALRGLGARGLSERLGIPVPDRGPGVVAA